MKDENASQDWVTAGLAELAIGGIDGVRVEVLAERLGVTKGGFYRRFKDRRTLLDAMLETWRDGRVAAIATRALNAALCCFLFTLTSHAPFGPVCL